MSSKLVVIEGLDGSGKQTQTEMLSDFLKTKGVNVKYLSFPDYSSPSSALVKMYLNSELCSNPSDINAYAAASFYAVDRFASFKKDWEKIYNSKNFILCDRYTTSNTYYQMCKLPETQWSEYLSWLYDYEYCKLGLPKPDATIYLNMPVEVSQKLMKKRYCGDETKKDLHESNVEFLKQCEKAANYVSSKSGWIVINCTKNGNIKSKEAIHKEIIEKLHENNISYV